MPVSAFVSYAHVDEPVLERLHKHLAMLRREGAISAWVDRDILAGGTVEREIFEHLDESSIFIALLSADYLNSNYCYEKEFARALELYELGRVTIVPVIAEPCDWKSSPFQQFVALPKDGKPISEWINPNNAFLDIVNGLRRVVEAGYKSISSPGKREAPDAVAPRRVRVKRDFDAIDKGRFADHTFEVVRNYFSSASVELQGASDDVKTQFEDMSSTAFTCTIVNRARREGGEAHITVRNQKGRRFAMGDLTYVFEAHSEGNSANGSVRIEADEYDLYLSDDSYMGRRRGEAGKLTPEAAAERLWNQFVEQAGIAYE